MADKDQINDEYQFADLDAIEPDTVDQSGSAETVSESPKIEQKNVEQNNVKRNAIIVVAIVIFAMVVYKIVGSFSSEKKVATNTIIPVPAVTTPTPVVTPSPIQQQPEVPVAVVPVTNIDNQVNQKISILETAQQSMRTDVSSVNEQLGGISTNVNALITKMAELNGIIASLSAKVDEQSREIEQMTIRREQAKRVQHSADKVPHYPKYYLQAVIPGRAWLIATNGATLTVREGTIVAGYGMVKLIDANQGRVTTSSGQVIRFSQEDS